MVVLVSAVTMSCGRIGFDPAANSISNDGDGGTTPSTDGGIVTTNANYAFVTSTTMSITTIGSLANADAICQARATAANLPGTYVAWLSTTAAAAKDRLGSARGWVRVDGKPFADTVADIVASRIQYPIRVNELGGEYNKPKDAEALTLTAPDGTAAAGATCADLTSTSASGEMGVPVGSGLEWTGLGPSLCASVSYHLYCFGIDRTTALPPNTGPRRNAFASSAPWSVGGGLASADALCTSEASAAGLPGSYLALLATSTASAASRFAAGVPWARVDGTIVTTEFEAPQTPIDRTANGTLIPQTYVWVGASDFVSAGVHTCSDWTNPANVLDATSGNAAWAGPMAISASTDYCSSTTRYLYCLEQ
jgi:hypothetical protein